MAVVGDGSQILSLNRKYLYSKLETGKFLQRCFDEPAIKNEKKWAAAWASTSKKI